MSETVWDISLVKVRRLFDNYLPRRPGRLADVRQRFEHSSTACSKAIRSTKIAIVATSHFLARAMWSMLKHGTHWQENPRPKEPTPAPALQQKVAGS